MDMNGLKTINDRYGHREGDLAIQYLAHALRRETEKNGICASYRGDEFSFAFLSGQSFLPLLEKIRIRLEAAAREFLGSKDYLISASMGAFSCPVRECLSLDAVLAEADRALYADKSRQKQKR